MWDEQVKSIFVPTEQATLTNELCAPLIATLPLEVLIIILDFEIFIDVLVKC